MFPLGHTLNHSPHSVCVSLPTMASIIGYEHKDPAVLNALKSGYPRFFRNPLIERAEAWLTAHGTLQPGDSLLPSAAVAADAAAFTGRHPQRDTYPVGPFHALATHANPTTQDALRRFLQHTGNRISSREAEAFLSETTALAPFPEDRAPHITNPDAHIRQHLHAVYGTATPDDVFLYRSGMNAFYAAFRAIQSVQALRHRTIWIQLGWLYVDTSRILQAWAPQGAPPVTLFRVDDLPQLHEFLRDHGHDVAAIVTEVPSNPLLQTPDIEALHALALKYKAALVLDPTLASPHNVHVLPFSDVHINSLTKYAATDADVMLGSAALNPDSPFYDDLRPRMRDCGCPPAPADCARLAAQIDRYPTHIRTFNHNARAVTDFLLHHPAVAKVWHPLAQPSAYNFNWILHREAGPGAVISFQLKHSFSTFYDAVHLPKSPSFGARFSLLCPFMFLAHFDLVSTPQGRAFLDSLGLPHDLLRLSVGTESADAIIDRLAQALPAR